MQIEVQSAHTKTYSSTYTQTNTATNTKTYSSTYTQANTAANTATNSSTYSEANTSADAQATCRVRVQLRHRPALLLPVPNL
jgi:hypothetical protein